MPPLVPEYLAVTFAAVLTSVLWIPVVINRLIEMGPWQALSNPQPDVRPHADWAHRLANAHRNAVENLVVFAPLAIIVTILERADGLTAAASFAFVGSRIAHAIIYTLGVPLLRTIAFAVGYSAQMVIALRILGLL